MNLKKYALKKACPGVRSQSFPVSRCVPSKILNASTGARWTLPLSWRMLWKLRWMNFAGIRQPSRLPYLVQIVQRESNRDTGLYPARIAA